MMWDIKFTCTKCHRPYRAKSWKSVDVIAQPELRELLMSEKFNLNVCPNCDHPARVHGPFVLWEAYFVAVVLSQQLEAQEAIALIYTLLRETKPSGRELPTEVIVFSTLDKLRKVLVDPNLTRMRIPIHQLAQRDWHSVEHPIQEIADALLQNDMPERALLVYTTVIQHIPELFFHSEFRENFKVIAYAAGSRIAPDQVDTALEQFHKLEERLSQPPSQMPSLEPYNVSYCPIDETGETGEGRQGGDQHVVTLMDPFIKSPDIAPYELVRGLLLALAFSSLAREWLPGAQTEIERFKILAKAKLELHWSHLHPNTREELQDWFHKLTGARLYE